MQYIAAMGRHEAFLRTLGQRLRALRRARGWSRRELAGRSGLSERSLADLEAGRANPTLLRLLDLAAALGEGLDALLAEALDRRRVVALLGLRGAGKSTVGPRLARRLGRPFVELDRRIEEAAGMELEALFELHGQARYRELEREMLEEILADPAPKVLATGGGIVTQRETFARLRATCWCVWLKAEPEEHWRRVVAQGDRRPMRARERAFAELRALLAAREPLYRQADLTLPTDGRDPGALAAEIAARL